MKMVLMDHSLYRDRLGRAREYHISPRGRGFDQQKEPLGDRSARAFEVLLKVSLEVSRQSSDVIKF